MMGAIRTTGAIRAFGGCDCTPQASPELLSQLRTVAPLEDRRRGPVLHKELCVQPRVRQRRRAWRCQQRRDIQCDRLRRVPALHECLRWCHHPRHRRRRLHLSLQTSEAVIGRRCGANVCTPLHECLREACIGTSTDGCREGCGSACRTLRRCHELHRRDADGALVRRD